jgi:hypothetical protein
MKKTLREEYQELIKNYGDHDINVIFNGLKGYQQVRSYIAYREVKEEVRKLFVE